MIRNIQDAQYGGRRCYVDLHTPDFALLCAIAAASPSTRSATCRTRQAPLSRGAVASGPLMLEIDMLSGRQFAAAFAGPPSRGGMKKPCA